jgi:hypothetical protein
MTRVHHGVSCHGPCDARSPWLSGTMSPRRDANVPRDSQMRRHGSSHATSKSIRAETGATPLRGETSSLTGVSTWWGRSCLGPHINDTVTVRIAGCADPGGAVQKSQSTADSRTTRRAGQRHPRLRVDRELHDQLRASEFLGYQGIHRDVGTPARLSA